MGAAQESRSFDCVSRDKTARDFAQDDKELGRPFGHAKARASALAFQQSSNQISYGSEQVSYGSNQISYGSEQISYSSKPDQLQK